MNSKLSTIRILTLCAAAAVCLGALAPWLTGFGLSMAGTDSHMDGHITGLGGLLAIVALRVFRERIAALFAMAAGVLVAFLAISRIGQINDIGHVTYGANAISVGWGLWLTVVAGIGLVVGASLLLRESEVKPEKVQQR